jgi:futalosine hydrolase
MPVLAENGAPVAIVAAVEFELEPLQRRLHRAESLSVGRKPAIAGVLDGTPVILLAAGMGKTNAAQALTALLESRAVRGVLNTGVGGAYPGSGLGVGEVALATEENYGDEGVETPQGWISAEGIGIPLLRGPGGVRFNRFPLDEALLLRARQALAAREIAARAGPFVTVSCCSGTTQRGMEVAGRFGAICESMEGAALAHVAALYEVPFLEVRGISNAVEDRDLSRWRLQDAIEAACTTARVLLPVFGSPPGASPDP